MMRHLAAMGLFLLASPVRADSMRWGDRLVSVGEATSEVAIKCGPPTAHERRRATNADGSTQ